MQTCVFGLVHHTHPAPAQSFEDAVVRDGLTDQRKRGSFLGKMLGALNG